MIVKAGAGLLAGVIAGGLGFAFWPRVEPSVLSLRPAVEKPVFVVATEPARPAPAPAATLAVAPVETSSDKNSLVKLAAALRSDPAPPQSAAVLTRGIALKTGAPGEQAASFFASGLVALADGDVAGARAFLERASDEGDTRALMVLGDTYDPATLNRLGAVGIHGDAARARDYYARALAAGVGAARQRIAALDSKAN
jgi:hypothetical protein